MPIASFMAAVTQNLEVCAGEAAIGTDVGKWWQAFFSHPYGDNNTHTHTHTLSQMSLQKKLSFFWWSWSPGVWLLKNYRSLCHYWPPSCFCRDWWFGKSKLLALYLPSLQLRLGRLSRWATWTNRTAGTDPTFPRVHCSLFNRASFLAYREWQGILFTFTLDCMFYAPRIDKRQYGY